jgi:hypothetical protein
MIGAAGGFRFDRGERTDPAAEVDSSLRLG